MERAVTNSKEATHITKAHAFDYRDGLIIALLALIPLRRRTLAALRIGKHLVKLSITHNSCADRGAQPDIGETGQAAPHHDVPRRRIIGAREVSA